MGTRIEGAASARSRAGPFAHGARRLSDDAARACLAQGDRRAEELDLLINVGLYKDFGLAEPALASIIQEDLGANPGHPPRLGHHGTFSFDVMNGGCGVVTAAHLTDQIMRLGTARLGLVVAGDRDPSPRTSRDFRFAPVGGALLLARDDGPAGFAGFAFRTFPEHADLFEVRLQWVPARRGLLPRRGRSVLQVREHPRYASCAVGRAAEVATGFLEGAGLRPSDVGLLIASQQPARFAEGVASALGLGARLPALPPAARDAHTAAPIVALEAAMKTGELARARHALIVTVGAGLTVAVALYRGAA